MKKFLSLFAAILFAGSMMASEAIMQYTGGVTSNLVGDGANNAEILGLDADLFTVLADKGANQNLPGLNQANDIRLYADRNTGNGNTITVSIASGTITSIVLDIKQTATFEVKAGETAVEEAEGAYAINGTSFSIQNTTTGATTQLRLNKITITYESGEVPPTPSVNYYVVGTMNDWTVSEDYILTPNNEAEGQEFMGEFTFAANDEFKVVKNNQEAWFPDGSDNNFVITEAGDYTVYFRPDGQGGQDWHYGCIYAAKKEAPQPAEMTAIYDWAGEIGATILGATGVELSTVKIHTNTDEIPAIKFASSYVYADGKWLAIKPAEGGFKAGDVVSIAGVISNSDDTGAKYAQIDMYAADGATRLLRSENVVNGRTSADEPVIVTLTLEADQDSLFFGRYGNTNLFITMLKVERAGGVEPQPEPAKFYITGDAALVGESLAWNAEAIKVTEDSYTFENLAAGDYKLKVTVDGTWATAKGFNDLTSTADGLTDDADGNICFTLAEAGNVIVHYDGEFFFLNGNFYVAPVEIHYYLKNNWGTENWTWKELVYDEDNKDYELMSVVGGTGVDFNTAESDEGKTWIAWDQISAFDMATYEEATISALDTVVFMFDPEAVNVYTGENGISALIIGKYVEPEGCGWDAIDFLGDGSVEQTHSNQFKVCKVGEQPNVVNIQTPGFATETGIYVTFPSAVFGEISLAEGQYVIEGAGMVLYLSAFTQEYTEVTVNWDGNDIVFTVYNAAAAPQPVEHTYTVAGGSDVAFGTTWNPANTANDMALVEGLYTWEKTELTLAAGTIEFKVCEDHAWDVCYPASNYQLNIPEAGIYTITITFNADSKEVNAVATKTGSAVVIPTIAMHGNFLGSWADTENFTVAEGDATASLTLTLEVGNYEFGMRIGGSGNWTANGAAFTRESASHEIVAGQGNLTLAADEAGEYTFTWTFETNTLSIVFPIATAISNTAADAEAVKVLNNGMLLIRKGDKTYTIMGQAVK